MQFKLSTNVMEM